MNPRDYIINNTTKGLVRFSESAGRYRESATGQFISAGDTRELSKQICLEQALAQGARIAGLGVSG